MVLAALVVLALAPTALAQLNSLWPRSTWNVSDVYSRAEKVAFAQGAIDVFTKVVYPAGTMARAVNNKNDTLAVNSLKMLYAIARKDYVAGVRVNKGYVTSELGALLRNDAWYLAPPAGYTYVAGPRLHYALACLETFRVYGGDELHQRARDLWIDVQQLQVNDTGIRTGQHGNTSFLTQCYGASVLGAVADYWPLNSNKSSEIPAASWTSMRFLTLSARLASIEPINTTFYNSTLQGALLTEQFREQVLARFGSFAGCSLFSANLALGQNCLIDSSNPEIAQGTSSDCSTWFVEGLSVLDRLWINSTRTSTWKGQISQLLMASRLSVDGVLDDGYTWGPVGAFGTVPDTMSTKYDFLTSIPELWNNTNWDPQYNFTLRSFTAAQMNALMVNATRPGSNVYGNWSGPPTDTPTLNGMSAAIVALTAAIGTTNAQPLMPARSGLDLLIPPGAIVGILCAGVLLLACGAVGGVHWRRRRRRQRALALFGASKNAESETRIIVLNEKQQTAMVWGNQTPSSLPSTSISMATSSSFSSLTPSPLISHLPSLPSSASPDAEAPKIPDTVLPMGVHSPELPEDVMRKDNPSLPEPLEGIFRNNELEVPARLEPPPLSSSILDISENVRQLLQRTDNAPHAHTVDLRRRLVELGPIPEVLEALQDLLRNQDTLDGSLPRYEQAAQGNG